MRMPSSLLKRAGLIIPERVEAGLGVAGADGVRQAEVEERAERAAAFGLKQRVVHPSVRALGVDGLGDDVEIAGEDERRFIVEQRARVLLQALHPRELVG